MNLRLVRFAIVAIVTAAACSSDNEPMTAPSQPLDVSAALSASAAGDPWSYPNLSSSFANLPSFANLTGLSCAYSSANQRFDCAPASLAGLTFKTSYYLLGADGGSLDVADASKVAAIRSLVDVTGTFTIPPNQGESRTLTVDKHDDLTLSGLLSGTRTLNGSSTEHDVLAMTINGVNSSTALDITTSTVNLVLPNGSNKFPASGTITMDSKSATTVAPLPAVTTTTHSVLTFNGTDIATLVTTISGHTQTCAIDLTKFSAACS